MTEVVDRSGVGRSNSERTTGTNTPGDYEDVNEEASVPRSDPGERWESWSCGIHEFVVVTS